MKRDADKAPHFFSGDWNMDTIQGSENHIGDNVAKGATPNRIRHQYSGTFKVHDVGKNSFGNNYES
jgi:hypothetical protein